MANVLIIDDNKAYLEFIRTYINENFPALQVDACDNAIQGLAAISADLDLLLLDLEMPDMDGKKLLSYAIGLGLNKSRIIILSGHSADFLHEQFPMGSCLAVLNKHEARQKVVLDMIFNSLQVKSSDE
ncbi:MAG: response regulator [Desulfuromonadales bacterium]|jgi:DNA-binding response OmpR family regulator|nr:response regulator [Desulfuromonadales bacterium]